MIAARDTRPRATHLRFVAITLLAAAAGVVLGALLPHDPPADRPDGGARRVGLASGVARLPLPAGWVPLNRHSSIPGLHDATAVQGVHSVVALDIRPPEDPSLLPADVRAAADGALPAPRLRQLHSRRVWRYDLPGGGTPTTLVAMALPTSGGVVTIACEPDSASTSGASDDCDGAMGALRLHGASALAPAPETAARMVLPAIVARLNRQRRGARRALVATRSARRRSRAAERLALAYRDAADRLRPLAAGDARRLTVALAALARDHRVLAAASRRRDARSARRAGAAIERGEQRLAPLLTAVAT